MNPTQSDTPHGLRAVFAASIMWGLLPIYWRLLETVPALEILAYRVVFSCIFFACAVTVQRRWSETFCAFSSLYTVMRLILSSLLIAVNWFLYIWAVNNNHITETSLGYFLSPLCNVLFGFLLLREQLSRLQLLAVCIAGIGVFWALLLFGSVPYVALALASSFALYAFLRKTINIEALPGLLIESLFLMPFALVWILWLTWNAEGALYVGAWRDVFFLVFGGIFTSIPMALYIYAARHVRLTTLGFIQYISPSESLLVALFLYNEFVPNYRWFTFICIWIALALMAWNSHRSIMYSGNIQKK